MPLAIMMVHLLLGSLLNQFTWRLPADLKEKELAWMKNLA
jgi:hypothetical protein